MIGWTMCSGIGAPEVAAPWMDWRMAAEIENFPRAVLQSRFGYKLPEDHNQGDPLLWSDMTEVTPDLARSRGIPLPDVLVAGTPCQAFSVAGLRKGTEDARGNLTLKFVETCHAIVDARHDGKLAVLWENVPGVLSDKGNAFGCFLAGLVGADDALSAPDDGSWPGVGMVSGPRARVAWRVLDAQYFGVAQRRRRVFVVIDFGGAVDPASVLFEPQGLRGNTPPRRQAREGSAVFTKGSIGGYREGVGTLRASGGDLGGGSENIVASFDTWPAQVAPTLNAAFGSKQGLEDQHALNGAGLFVMGKADDLPEAAGTMKAMQGSGGWSNSADHAAAGYMVPEITQTLTSNGDAHSGFRDDRGLVATPWAVRRLTPNECHALQGFPQDHCAITYRGKPAADGPQYKALGNSMAVPVIAWIMDRIKTSMESPQKTP